MKKRLIRLLVFLISVLGFYNISEAKASEVVNEEKNEIEISFDLFENGVQSETYIDDDGNEITIMIELIRREEDGISPRGNGWSYLFPYGKSSYKVSHIRPNLGMSYYVDVDIPKSNINNSKITNAYDANHWSILGSLSDTSLTFTSKESLFSASASWLGGWGGSNVWLKGTLSGNELKVTARY